MSIASYIYVCGASVISSEIQIQDGPKSPSSPEGAGHKFREYRRQPDGLGFGRPAVTGATEWNGVRRRNAAEGRRNYAVYWGGE